MLFDFATKVTLLFVTNPLSAGWLSLCRNVSPEWPWQSGSVCSGISGSIYSGMSGSVWSGILSEQVTSQGTVILLTLWARSRYNVLPNCPDIGSTLQKV